MKKFKSDLKDGERRITQSINWDKVREYIKSTPNTSTIYIGADSKPHKGFTSFGLAVVVHIESSKGGHMFVEVSKMNRIRSIRERLLKEVEIVVEASMKLLDVIGQRQFQVHLDINPNPEHKSNMIAKEAIGWVEGQGFDYRIKPESWAASHAADMLVQ